MLFYLPFQACGGVVAFDSLLPVDKLIEFLNCIAGAKESEHLLDLIVLNPTGKFGGIVCVQEA